MPHLPRTAIELLLAGENAGTSRIPRITLIEGGYLRAGTPLGLHTGRTKTEPEKVGRL